MDHHEIFARRLRELRTKRRLSRCVASELCGLSSNVFSRYERGEAIPRPEALAQISDFFGVSMDYLWGRDEGA